MLAAQCTHIGACLAEYYSFSMGSSQDMSLVYTSLSRPVNSNSWSCAPQVYESSEVCNSHLSLLVSLCESIVVFKAHIRHTVASCLHSKNRLLKISSLVLMSRKQFLKINRNSNCKIVLIYNIAIGHLIA